MQLDFALPEPRTPGQLRGCFAAMASVLLGRPISFAVRSHEPQVDENGQFPCYVAELVDAEVSLTESLRSGTGNPRDGYGYEIDVVLTVAGLVMRLRGGGWDPALTELRVEFWATARQWLLLRQTLRRELGASNDRCLAPHIVRELLAPLVSEGELQTALVLARESLLHAKPVAFGRTEVVAWLAANDAGFGGAATRVREAPADLEGWLEFERQGGASLAPVFARLCPFELSRWTAAGLPRAPWFDHPAWPLGTPTSCEANWQRLHAPAHTVDGVAHRLAAALSGWQLGVDWQDTFAEALRPSGLGTWRWRVSRRVRANAEALLTAHVTLEGERRTPEDWSLPPLQLWQRPVQEVVRWTWMSGPSSGDALVLVERALPQRTSTPTPSGIAFTVVGSSDFIAHATSEMVRLSKQPWWPVTAATSLEPWEQTPAPTR